MKILIESNVRDKGHIYKTGNCHIFALAMHRLTGAPLVSIARQTQKPEDQWDGNEEIDMYDFEHAHAGILIGKDIFIDVDGAHRFDSKTLNCHWVSVSESTSEPYMEFLGSDQSLLESCYTCAEEADIHRAMCDAMQWGCVAVVNRLFRSMERAVDSTPEPG